MLDIVSLAIGKSMAKGGSGGSSGGGSDVVAYVTFMSEDGTVELGKRAVIKGDDCPEPVADGLFSTPTKESTVSNTFSFSGWSLTSGGTAESSPFTDITEDKTLYAVFASAVRYYTVRFYDGETLLKTESVAYGGSSSYEYVKPDYFFDGWTPEPTNVTGDMDCYGTWTFDDGYIRDDWDVIAQAVSDGTYLTKYAIGDMKQLVVRNYDGTDVTLDMEIVAFDHDDLADGSGKAGITFLSTKLLEMNSPYADDESYWWESDAPSSYSAYSTRKYLNSTVHYKLPDTLKNSIKSVTKLSQKADNTVGSTSDKLWIPSFTEVGFTSSNSNNLVVDGQGECYSNIFSDNNSRKKQETTSTSYDIWILRSRYKNKGYYGSVSSTGAVYTSSVSGTSNKIKLSLLGFCI